MNTAKSFCDFKFSTHDRKFQNILRTKEKLIRTTLQSTNCYQLGRFQTWHNFPGKQAETSIVPYFCMTRAQEPHAIFQKK